MWSDPNLANWFSSGFVRALEEREQHGVGIFSGSNRRVRQKELTEVFIEIRGVRFHRPIGKAARRRIGIRIERTLSAATGPKAAAADFVAIGQLLDPIGTIRYTAGVLWRRTSRKRDGNGVWRLPRKKVHGAAFYQPSKNRADFMHQVTPGAIPAKIAALRQGRRSNVAHREQDRCSTLQPARAKIFALMPSALQGPPSSPSVKAPNRTRLRAGRYAVDHPGNSWVENVIDEIELDFESPVPVCMSEDVVSPRAET